MSAAGDRTIARESEHNLSNDMTVALMLKKYPSTHSTHREKAHCNQNQ
jgi:hypothetical protein